MRTAAILLNIAVISLVLLRAREGVSMSLPLALVLATSVVSLFSIYWARNHFMGSEVRPPKEPTIFAEVYQDFDESRWHAAFYVLCSPWTKVTIEDYFFPKDLEEKIGFQLPQGAHRRAKDPKKKHLYVPAVLVEKRLRPGRLVQVSFSASNLANAHGHVHFSINYSFTGGGGSRMIEIPVGRNWEAVESFENEQKFRIVAALKDANYPPFS